MDLHGHTHRERRIVLNGALITQANHWGRHHRPRRFYMQMTVLGGVFMPKQRAPIPVDEK